MAMGGTAYAVNEWTGANIQDETLTGADIRGRGATSSTAPVNGLITTYDIAGQAADATHGTPEAPGTLTTWDIADGQIRGIDLANGTIANGDLGDNAVTGAKVLNSSLSGADVTKGTLNGGHITDDTLTGGDIEDGSVARADLAPDARGFSEIRIENGTQAAGARGEDVESRAFCPLGWRISGGGYNAFVQAGNDGDLSIGVSQPFAGSSTERAQWWTHGRNVGSFGAGSIYLTAYAICVR
jgi:hypothetical protein